MKNTKKIIPIVLCSMILGITGCSSGVSQKEYDKVVEERDKYKELYESISSATATELEKEESIEKDENVDYVSQLDIAEYSYVNSINNTIYCMVIKNNSNQTLSLNVNVTANDKNGKLVGAQTINEYAVESGYEVVLSTSFDGDKAEKFVYDITPEIEKYYSPVSSEIESTVTKADKKVIVSCKNTGNETAQFVKASALFFKNDRLVYYNETYCVDNSFNLEVGKTISKEIDAFQEFDDVKIYISGRK